MKASLITIHTGPNYGTVLQVIASVFVLKKHNIDVTVVNYIPPRSTYGYILKGTFKSIREKKGLAKIKALLKGMLSLFRLIETNRVFQGVIRQRCSMSNRILFYDSFAEKCPLADVYITGSDQVWNTVHNQGIDTHYFFDGIKGRKVALSSSIGMDSLSEEEKRVFRHFLIGYEAISVREDRAVELLSEIGVSSIQVLDPTFMLNREEWYNTISFKRLIKEKYLLIYTPYNTQDKGAIIQFSKRIAYNKDLKIVTFSGDIKKTDNVDYILKGIGPKGFLSLMYYADCVITNSFHGTAFSINLNRDFWVFLPTKFTSRITSILSKCGLENRIVSDNRRGDYVDNTIDYDVVNSILDQERARFNGFISKHIVNCQF